MTEPEPTEPDVIEEGERPESEPEDPPPLDGECRPGATMPPTGRTRSNFDNLHRRIR